MKSELGRGWTFGIAAAALGVWLGLGSMNLYWADLNQDEGWYLYAADRVVHGEVPYRDFAFTQGPVLPYVYALVRPVLAEGGLAAMRGFTLLLSLPVLFLCAVAAARLAPPRLAGTAGLLALCLLAANVYHSQFTTIVKTYSLCSVFIGLGVLAFVRAADRERPVAGILTGLAFAAAAATRLSAGFLLAGLCVFALAHPRLRATRAWFYMGIGGAIGLALLFLPFFVIAPEGFLFGLFEYHVGRSAGSAGAALVYKAGFLSRFAGAYFVAAAAAVALGLLAMVRPGRWADTDARTEPGIPALWCAALAGTLVHLSAPFPYDDYQVIVFPLVAVALAAGVATALHRLVAAPAAGTPDAAVRWARWLVLSVLLASIGAAFSSPVNQDWFVQGRDRIWWQIKEGSPVRALHDAAERVRALSREDDELLTQDVYLAVEAQRRVPRGMELGPFCYYPEMEESRAERLRVLTEDSFLEQLATSSAPVAAFSGYGFALRSPEVTELNPWERKRLQDMLEKRYRLAEEIPHFGQAHTTLRIYVRAE